MNKILGASWKTTLTGLVSAVLLFLQSWYSNNHSVNWKDPALMIGLGFAVLGFFSKATGVTGGKTLEAGATPDATLHQEENVKTAGK